MYIVKTYYIGSVGLHETTSYEDAVKYSESVDGMSIIYHNGRKIAKTLGLESVGYAGLRNTIEV